MLLANDTFLLEQNLCIQPGLWSYDHIIGRRRMLVSTIQKTDIAHSSWKQRALDNIDAPRKLFLLENSLPTFKSPKSNVEPIQSRVLCGRSRNSNTSSVDISILCMWAGGEYALNRGSSSFLSEPLSTSSDGIGSGSENNATSAPPGSGS
ncbi:hypothetical protein J1N35_022046 [Gossypium stocksii]|uniref:Uncharacterized protein n=1 Tax=Gossypium stocksii TaxID=47602 RepID=A0A9D4A2K7_9ROSI|nr:hypothetical protein J1N35_022046 [Gossypium stocksii]